jgi:replication-associated recombination protein RarA
MMGKVIQTKNGYDFYVVSSCLQKAIRRNQPALAGWAIVELFESGFHAYAWRRLLVISAEDCDGVITTEIEALFRAFELIREQAAKTGKVKGLIFLAKAVLLLCAHGKNRDADHLIYLTRANALLSDDVVEAYLATLKANGAETELPEYVFDVHTWQGRRKGKTKAQFWTDENRALIPKQPGLFDAHIDGGVPSPPTNAKASPTD